MGAGIPASSCRGVSLHIWKMESLVPNSVCLAAAGLALPQTGGFLD